jgi:ornithine cyclodeaminase
VDTYQGGLKETGDIVIPLKNGLIKESDVKADLYGLSKVEHKGREAENEITVFKSLGHASEDLIAANYFYSKVVN